MQHFIHNNPLSLRTRIKESTRMWTELQSRDRCFRFSFSFYRFNKSKGVSSAHLAGFGICRCNVTRIRYVTGLLGTLWGTVGIRGRVFRPPKRFRRTCRSRLSERVERSIASAWLCLRANRASVVIITFTTQPVGPAIFRESARTLAIVPG